MIEQISRLIIGVLAVVLTATYLHWLFFSEPKSSNERHRVERKIDSLYKERERVHVHIYRVDSITSENRENLLDARKLTDRIISEILNSNENEEDNYIIVHRDSLCNECTRAASGSVVACVISRARALR